MALTIIYYWFCWLTGHSWALLESLMQLKLTMARAAGIWRPDWAERHYSSIFTLMCGAGAGIGWNTCGVAGWPRGHSMWLSWASL